MLTLLMPLSVVACSSNNTQEQATTTTTDNTATTTSSTVLHDRNGDGKLIVYGIYKSGDQTWFLNEGAAAKETVEAAGGEFFYVDVQTDGQKELDAINTAIANNADGIVTCTPDQTMSQNIVNLCEEAGVPVVACDDALEVDGKKIAPWVGISGYVIGQSIGEWVADYIEKNNLADDPSVGLLMMCMPTVSSCVPRTEGEQAALEAKFPALVADSNRFFTVDYDGTTEKGNTTATDMFAAHPEITSWIIFGANEEGVIGAVRALETAGLDANSCAVGMGAYLAPAEYEKGTALKAAPYFSDKAIGQGSVNTLFDLIDGKSVELETAVPAEMTTPENYKEILGL